MRNQTPCTCRVPSALSYNSQNGTFNQESLLLLQLLTLGRLINFTPYRSANTKQSLIFQLCKLMTQDDL